jgi:hypothetical protein
MKSRFSSRFGASLSVLALALGMTLSNAALADEPVGEDFQRQEATTQYTAPLSQTTQPSYVPQSVALSGPHQLAYHEGEPVPPGYTPVQRVRKGAIIGGAILFGSLYMMSTMGAAANADDSSHRSSELVGLWVPAVGPFIAMAGTSDSIGKYFLAIDGLGQVAGSALLLYGLLSPKTVLVRNDLTVSKPKVSAAPIAAGKAPGVGLVGTF